MSGPTTQEYQPLSQALQFQSQQQEFPQLQLAPSEYQKQLLALAQAKQRHESHESLKSIIAATQPSAECAMSISSSREISPTVGVDPSPSTSNGQKRKSDTTEGGSTKKRRTDPSQEQATNVPAQFSLGTQYPYPFTYPGAPPIPGYNSGQTPNAASDMSFNEFQWRLLNLCGEFYEAATELIRSTPQPVLSQAFQLLDRGTGLDPISVLKDARRTCDMLLTSPQALSAPPPPPTALPQQALNSLAYLNARGNYSPAPTAPPVSAVAPPSYHPPKPTSMVVDFSSRPKERERAPTNLQGTWKDEEIQKLKGLAEKYKIVGDSLAAEEDEEEDEEEPSNGSHVHDTVETAPKSLKKSKIPDVDWDKVVEEFGDGRSRHQVLIKATYLGLKTSSSIPAKKHKKKSVSAASLPPPSTIPSARSVSAGDDPAQPAKGQGSQGTPGGSSSNTNMAAQQKSSSKSAPVPTADLHKATTTAMTMSHQPPHALNPYGQPAWYPHPQNPYYPYQPLFYSPHPQNYSLQGYGMQPPPHGYYPPSYPPLQVPEVPSTEKSAQQPKGKRKDVRRDEASVTVASTGAVPPPSFPSKVSLPGGASAAKTSSESMAPTAVPKPAGPLATDEASGQRNSSASAPMDGHVLSQSGRIFTYPPLTRVSGDAATERPKEV